MTQVLFIVETHGEDDFEIADFSLMAGDMSEADSQSLMDELELDEMDPAAIVGVNPETEMINEIDPGVYEYICEVDDGEVTVISSRKLSEAEVDAVFSTDLPIPAFEINP